MNLQEALRDPHDLTYARVAAFCRYVDLKVEANTICSLHLLQVVKATGKNDPSLLGFLRDRIGVYAFRLRGCVIYVGECGTKNRGGDQDLKDRIPQHLTEKTSSANLRINWYKCHGRNFATFQAEMAQCCLWTVSFPRSEDTQKIARLEHLLIGVLGPKYCHVP